jgi:flagellar biosynthesis protein FlhB
VARTPLLAAGLCCLVLAGLGGPLLARSQGALAAGFAGWGGAIADINAGQGLQLADLPVRLALPVPWLGLGVLVALAAGVAQVGLRWTPRALGAVARRGSPVPGRERFAPSSLAMEPALLALVLLVGFATLGVVVVDELPGLLGLLERSPARAVELFGALFARLLTALGLGLCALAALDWARRRHALLRALRMTRSELERERRELEADPRLRRRRLQAHRASLDGPVP